MAPLQRRTYRAQVVPLTRGFAMMQGTADDQVNLATAGARIQGVLEESTRAADVANAPVSIITHGECIAICGAAVNAGDRVKSDANGRFITTVTPGDEVGGTARSSAAALGDEFVLDLTPHQY
jgi:hypothetical protein